MYTIETLQEVIGDKRLVLDFKFTHGGIVDAQYAKIFITLVNCGLVNIGARIEDLSVETPKEQAEECSSGQQSEEEAKSTK